jgi:hypothetical protein
VLAHGDGEAMAARALADDVDQGAVAQQLAVLKNRRRDVDLLVGEDFDHFDRGALGAGQLFRQGLADRPRHVLDQLFQDVVHQRRFVGAEFPIALVNQIADRTDQGAAAFGGAVPRQIKELADIGRDHGFGPILH